MTLFPVAHAAHTDWHVAARQVVQQLRGQLLSQPAQRQQPYRLGLLYIAQGLASHAQALLALLAQELPQVTDWVGSSGHAVLAMEHEYPESTALAVMLLDLPAARYRVYSGVAPLAQSGAEAGFQAHSALVHSCMTQTDLPDLLLELSERTSSGNLFGALGDEQGVQFACRAEDLRTGMKAGIFRGGFSGVAFASEVACMTRMAQGCAPLGAGLEITEAKGPVLMTLEGEPALPRLLQMLDVDASPHAGGGWQAALSQLRKTVAAIAPLGRGQERGALTDEAQVLNIVGLDPVRQGLALSSPVKAEQTVIFCQRQSSAARHELMQMGAALKDALQPDFAEAGPLAEGEAAVPQQIRGAIYVSSKGRGNDLFGDADAELKLLRHALGPVPLIGIVADAQLMDAKVHQLAGVLTVFTEKAS